MKHYLLAALLLGAAPVLAQTAPAAEPTGIELLDAKNGFRKFKFGTPLTDLPDMQKRRDYYIDPLEFKEIGGVTLEELRFYFYDGKLSRVTFSTNGEKNCDKLFEILKAQYGGPQLVEAEGKVWIGNKVKMVFIEKKTYGAYGTSFAYALVSIESADAADKQDADKQAAAKKAAAKDL